MTENPRASGDQISSKSAGKPKNSHGNLLFNLGFNIIIPTLIMTKLSGDEHLGPSLAIVVALAFPLGFGAWDYYKTREANLFSILGFVSVLLTGGISLLELPAQYIAIKEAAIPGILGLATLGSMYTPYPLVKTFLFNEQIMQAEKVNRRLEETDNTEAFARRLKNASYMVAASFGLSSMLNYALAKYLLQSPPGTAEYTAELGRMTALSFPVIALPSTIVLFCALMYLIKGITSLTGYEIEDILHGID